MDAPSRPAPHARTAPSDRRRVCRCAFEALGITPPEGRVPAEGAEAHGGALLSLSGFAALTCHDHTPSMR